MEVWLTCTQKNMLLVQYVATKWIYPKEIQHVEVVVPQYLLWVHKNAKKEINHGSMVNMSTYHKCPHCGGQAIYGDMGYHCMSCGKEFLPFAGRTLLLPSDKPRKWSQG
jgi:DNA-directed RNA polymerase subunit RPC12/RpoP